MHWHVEVVRLELVSHFTKRLQRILFLSLLEPERLHRLGHFGSNTLRAAPIAFRNFGQRRHEAESVVRVVAAVTQQHLLFGITLAAVLAHVLCQLKQGNKNIF